MKLTPYLLVLPLVALGLASCGRGNSSDAATDIEIVEFDMHQKLLSAQQAYRVESDGDTVYLNLSTSIQWPERLGGNDIKVLQDSLLAVAYADSTASAVRPAIIAFLSDTTLVEEAIKVTPVDSLPDDAMTYFAGVSASVMDINEEMVTYQVVTSSFLGGPHPMTSTHPFTYDFADSRVLDNNNIFLPGTPVDSIMPVITEALARQLGVPVRRLEHAGIFVSQLTYPGLPYVSGNTLYFHYDPYEIGPYSMGAIDVAVYPYEIDRFVTPSVRRLFDEAPFLADGL